MPARLSFIDRRLHISMLFRLASAAVFAAFIEISPPHISPPPNSVSCHYATLMLSRCRCRQLTPPYFADAFHYGCPLRRRRRLAAFTFADIRHAFEAAEFRR
jgi:hypothetical protein